MSIVPHLGHPLLHAPSKTVAHYMICQKRSTCVRGTYYVPKEGVCCLVCRKELDPTKEYPGVKFTVVKVDGRRVAQL